MNRQNLAISILLNVFISVAVVILLVPSVTNRNTGPVNNQGEYVLSESENQVVDIVERVNPAVLSIVVSRDVPVVEQYYIDPFGGLFGNQFLVPQQRDTGRTEERRVGSGSGFIVSPDGLVVTNKHVVDIENGHYVGFDASGKQYDLKLIDRDPTLDIAVLQIQGSGTYPYVSFGDSDSLEPGQTVIAIGNALGEFSNSVSVGVVSGLSRSILAGTGFGQSELLENVIQTDAAINPGNSGGPLLNLAGQVVGVNVAVAQGSENIGFALPSDVVSLAVSSVKDNGRIVRPYLGVRYVMLTPEIAEQAGIEQTEGALITGSNAVDPQSPAGKAGLEEGDIVVSVNGEKLSATHPLASAIRSHQVGDTITLTVIRNGQNRTFTVSLAEAKRSS